MSINWRTDYAMRIMYETAKHQGDGRTSVQEISLAGSVPYDYARQIAYELVKAGLLDSRRGAKGGMTLARPAEQITLLDIFEAVGEPPTISLCTHDTHVCDRTAWCPIHNGVWRALDDKIAEHLASVTLRDCVVRGERLMAEIN